LVHLHPKYSVALKAAVEASEKIMEIYTSGFSTELKSDGSPVTQADLASSAIIDSYLSTTGIPITGEESEASSYVIRQHWEESWCVDPLDGTREFVKQNGEFAVNIALIQFTKAVFGLIASPVHRKILIGGENLGVYLLSFEDIHEPENWRKIEIPKAVNTPLVVACSRSHFSGPILSFLSDLREKHPSLEFMQMGSSLKFFELALGKADTYPRYAPTMEWDIAAGQAILETLGGSVVDAITLEPLTYNKENLTNPNFVAKSKALLAFQ
jgi:3'(2'), 5'-bisphosphate nucleotidase